MLMECHLGKCRNQFKSKLLSKDQYDIFKGFFEDDTRIKKCLIYFKVYLLFSFRRGPIPGNGTYLLV